MYTQDERNARHDALRDIWPSVIAALKSAYEEGFSDAEGRWHEGTEFHRYAKQRQAKAIAEIAEKALANAKELEEVNAELLADANSRYSDVQLEEIAYRARMAGEEAPVTPTESEALSFYVNDADIETTRKPLSYGTAQAFDGMVRISDLPKPGWSRFVGEAQ